MNSLAFGWENGWNLLYQSFSTPQAGKANGTLSWNGKLVFGEEIQQIQSSRPDFLNK